MVKLYLAPMEELTGYVFRNTLSKHFGCVDKYFTPFISPDNRIMKTRSSREIIPANNEGLCVVPQLLTNDSDLFNEAAELITGLGYEEININFGCPSNTVTAKFKGSGILRSPGTMDRFLDGVFNEKDSIFEKHPDLKISVKTRVGYNDTSDFDDVTEVLNRYPFSEIIVHPRLKKDLYNGSVRMEMFDMACEKLTGDIVYNGDIYSTADIEKITEKYDGKISAVMIGRGAITDPGIFRHIRTGEPTTRAELYDFLTDLYEYYRSDFGDTNCLAKMKEVWSYTTKLIPDEKTRRKVFKDMIKAKTGSEYKDAVLAAKEKLPTIIQ